LRAMSGRRWGRRERALLWGVLVAAWEAACGQLRYSVPEEMPKGSFVGDVAKDLALDLPALRDRGVRLVSEGRTQYFALHGKTGHLVTAERIDREQLCESVQQCVLRCELIAEGEMKVYEIEVEITDINDNAPSFREAETELRMSEMTAPGSHIPVDEAHDTDVGRNSLQSYELSGDEHFSLAVQTGPGGDQRPELVLAKALDREEAAFHELVLRAIDGGEPARTGTARIRVAVLDANDNAPVFSAAEYSVRVAEDVPVGSTLLTLTATDADEGRYGHVKYALKKITEKASKIFQLDSETGAITLVRSLDFEEGDSYELVVQAHDGGGLFDTAKLSVIVTDVNDNAPEISVRSTLSEISEDAPSGTVVALLHVHDRDSGANGEVRCSLDQGLAPRSAEPGALVAKVVAVDADAGQNAWLSYELAKATEPGLFRVGLHSGEVRTARFPLARDAARQSLVVVVKDHGRPALSATATLTVVLAESVAELLSELGSAAAAAPGEPAGSLTRWLVVAVAAVSCLFLAFLLLLLALRLRRWRRSQLLAAGSGALRGVPASHFVGIDGVRAFLHSYSHEVSLTADSRKSQLRLSGGSCCDTLPARPPPDEPAPLLGEDPAG
ncbi:PCDG2 protein, partial [Hemiprocne comata]|nr:PCDG2 protein [Hemiprocne comata]